DERRRLRHARLRETIEGAADLELDGDSRLRGERLRDDSLDRVLPVTAPHADHERIRGERGRRHEQRNDEREPHHRSLLRTEWRECTLTDANGGNDGHPGTELVVAL